MDEDDKEDISNEIRRQYDNYQNYTTEVPDKVDNNKRDLSKTMNSTGNHPKHKRRQTFHPDGSKNEADTESDSGQSSANK